MFEAWKARRAAARQEREARREAARAEREAREAAAAAEERRREAASRREAIESELSFARQRLDAVLEFTGVTGSDVPDQVDIVLKKGEAVFCVVTDAVLIEPRKGPGQWKGFNQGVSVPIPGTRLRYRVGASKGSFQAGEDTPTPIDTGTFVATTTRGVFTGTKQSREWMWSKLLGVTHHEEGWTAMAVSNRQKVSGIGVDSPNRDSLEFWIDLAVARATGTVDELEADCRSDVEQLTAALLATDEPAAIESSTTPPAALPPSTH